MSHPRGRDQVPTDDDPSGTSFPRPTPERPQGPASDPQPATTSATDPGGTAVPAASVRTSVLVPLRLAEGTEVTASLKTFHGLRDAHEHLAVVVDGPAQDGEAAAEHGVPLVRLHSECLTGDVFASERCDCGPQLHEALGAIAGRGGILLYLRQEGRGIGLYNKLDAYRLQDGGLDTYEANRALGLADDLRDYSAAAQMLLALGHGEIDLLTNNPDKAGQLADHGIKVRRTIRTAVHANPHNALYLTAKAVHTRHTIRFLESVA
jgi:GTP cyclohydrolase II